MIVDMTDTTSGEIAGRLVEFRHRAGMPATGMVLTLIIVADEAKHYDALRAAHEAAHEHPSRILVVIPRGGRDRARMDAEVRFGGDAGPGETIVMRLYGQLSPHGSSVVLPLLLPDAPVVTWWPGGGPDAPAVDQIGQLAQRRVTDAAESSQPLKTLADRATGYTPGDTDLAWTRVTGWRTLLAAALDQPYPPITGGEVACPRKSPSAELLAVWLEAKLGITVERKNSRGPGITGVKLKTVEGDISISRPDGRTAHLTRPGQPERLVALHQRETTEILAEEMRRLDPDEVYGEMLALAAKSTAKVEKTPAAGESGEGAQAAEDFADSGTGADQDSPASTAGDEEPSETAGDQQPAAPESTPGPKLTSKSSARRRPATAKKASAPPRKSPS